MFDRSKFLDIEPYDREGAEAACARIKEHPEYIYALATALFPEADEKALMLRKQFTGNVLALLDNIHGYDDFQKQITCGVFLDAILKYTLSGFSYSGQEKLSPDQSYLFVSNHRDIVLDCALLDLALFQSGLPICEMAIGDNLLANSFIEDIFKLNGAIIVKRDLPVREKYLETVRLSEYFTEKVASGKSIWVAQKSGRSKDGIDVTHPSIIKMLHLHKKREGVSFADVIRGCRIVPVAVSYEYDPNDVSKAREEVTTIHTGQYEKSRYEDLFSMIRGLRDYKGHVHIAIGDVIEGEWNSADDVALEIDRQIHSNYRLYGTNWFSYDYLAGNRDNSDKYGSDFDPDAFLARYAHLNDEVRTFILNSYANPVRSHLKAVN